jgi:ribosomal protein S18 acetylase RimI-like enzyme
LTEKQLTRAVNDLRLRKLLKLDALIDVIQRNPTHRGVTLLRPLLEIAQPEPTRSELEDAFLKLIRRNRLPIPQMNVHVCGHRVDAYFPQHRLIVELDGWETHGLRSAFVDDRRKDAEILAATGIPTVRFVYDDTVNRVDKTVARLNVILKTRALATPNLQSMTIQVRAATVNDASAIARINVESWRAAYRGIVSERFLNGISISARERAWRERIIVDTTRVTMVAENGGNVLGYCGLSTPSRDEDAGFGVAEIAAIYVHPSLWRTGTGRKLMEAALATLSEAGWGAVTLWVFAANSQARAFYDRYGFTLDGSTQTHPELGPGAVEVRLRLSL